MLLTEDLHVSYINICCLNSDQKSVSNCGFSFFHKISAPEICECHYLITNRPERTVQMYLDHMNNNYSADHLMEVFIKMKVKRNESY